MARNWVSFNQDKVFGYEKDGKFHEVGVVKAGSVGFITDEEAPEGEVYVRFPECHWSFKKDELVEVSPYDLETSIGIIEEFEGHHTGGSYSRGGGEFQFNIKFYHWETSPLAEKYLNEDEISNARWDILENELRNSFDQSWCDGSFAEDLGWVKSFHTAGRMGGWLVLSHKYGYSSDYFKEELYDIEYCLQQLDDSASVADYTGRELSDEQVERWQEEMAEVEERKRELQLEANDLARELELTQYYINSGKEQLAEYMKTEDCWELFYEHKIQEEEEKLQYEQYIEEARQAWKELDSIATDEIRRLMDTVEVILPAKVRTP